MIQSKTYFKEKFQKLSKKNNHPKTAQNIYIFGSKIDRWLKTCWRFIFHLCNAKKMCVYLFRPENVNLHITHSKVAQSPYNFFHISWWQITSLQKVSAKTSKKCPSDSKKSDFACLLRGSQKKTCPYTKFGRRNKLTHWKIIATYAYQAAWKLVKVQR